MIQEVLPCNNAANNTNMLFSRRPPLRPYLSATIPVTAPPIIPPTQNIETAIDHIIVTCDCSAGPVVFV